MPALPQDDRIEKWKRWLADIEDELIGIAWNRAIYRGVTRIANDHGELPPSAFFDFLGETYATTQALAVRRQAERNLRGFSLGTLLHEIADDPSRLTRARYVAEFNPNQRDRGDEEFTRDFAGEAGDHLDPAIVHADIGALEVAVARIREYVDRHLAHHDHRGVDELPRYEDLNTAIDAMGDLVGKYARLITGAGLGLIEPVPQYDWTAVFREPWIKPGH